MNREPIKLRTKRERQIAFEQYERGVNVGKSLGRTDGYAEGKKEANLESERRGLETRLRLAESYAAVFEAIARSANMFFDGGTNALK